MNFLVYNEESENFLWDSILAVTDRLSNGACICKKPISILCEFGF
jgi:hypothetical protein